MQTSTDRDDRRNGGAQWLARWLVVTLTALVGVAAALPGHAQPQPTQGDASAADPPSRAARLSEVNGQVWLYNPDSNEWASAALNQPLTSGDRIATDNDGRAEITLGTTTLRLDTTSELEIVRLDDARYAVRLHGGSVAARVRNVQALNEFELATDEGSFRLQGVGRYRFDRAEQTSDVTVYEGRAIYENGNTALPVAGGQHAQFWIDAGGVPQYAMVATVNDAFFAWNEERDRSAERVAAPRYVSPEMTGAEDLDRYGQWQQTPDYGPIWVPAVVPVGWAPYSAGHWAWVRPWGWTWVDDQRWGFAPFHYGRWVNYRNAWCWAPGTYVARPVYAPALVAWVGGPRVGVSLAVGGGAPVGWFPLAPREVYVPSYRASTRYVREVNFTHVTNITTITTIVNNRHGEADRRDFANRHFEHAVTFVPADVMTRRQPVGPAAARFRNDPQVRAFVNEGRPAPVLTAPPVATPPAVARATEGRPPPRPPYAGRPPGTFAGRPDAARPEPGRAEGTRPAEPVRPDVAAGRESRPAPIAGGAAPPSRAAPGLTATAPAVPVAPPAAVAAPPRVAMPAPSRAVPPSPVQRGAQPAESTARPGFVARDGRPPAEGGAAPRPAPIPVVRLPNPNPNPDGAGTRRAERGGPPRGADGGHGGEAARPVIRLPEPTAAVVAPVSPRPVDLQHPPGEPKTMTRPETPRREEQRREAPREAMNEKQR